MNDPGFNLVSQQKEVVSNIFKEISFKQLQEMEK
jgi:hypothetical protein